MTRILVLVSAMLVLGGVVIVRNFDDWFGEGAPKERQKSSSSTAAAAKLPAIDRNLVGAIEVSDATEKIRVVKQGDLWVLPDSFDFPAQEDKVKGILDALVDLDLSEPVGSVQSRHHLYEVEDGGKAKRLVVENVQGKPIVDLLVGKQDMSGGRTVNTARNFVRPFGSDTVFVHGKRLTHLLHTSKRIWLDARLTRKDYKEINELVKQANTVTLEYDDVELGEMPMPGMPEVKRTGERVRLVLDAKKVEKAPAPTAPTGPTPTPTPPSTEPEKAWTFREPEATQSIETYAPIVDGIVRSFLGGRFDEVKSKDASSADFGLEKPVLSVTIGFEDGTSRTLKVGALIPSAEGAQKNPGTSQRYGTISDGTYVFALPEYQIRAFQKRPDEFKNPATATPPPTAVHPSQRPIALPEEGGDTKPAGGG